MSMEQKQAHRTDWRSPKQAGEGSIRSLGLADATSTYRAREQQVPLYSSGNHTRRPVINHNGKEHENEQTYAWLPRWPSGKESNCQCRRCKGHGFDPCVGKIPWRRKWQPTPIFLPGKLHRLRSLAGYSPWDYKESDIYIYIYIYVYIYIYLNHFAV